MPSKKILERKIQTVEKMTEKIKNCNSMVLADYRGLTVEQDTELRNALREADVEYKVVKNTLTGFALKNNDMEELGKHLKGPTAIAISNDPVAPAKILFEYSKKHQQLEIKAGMVEGKIMEVDGIKELANLPSREELITMVVRGVNGPLAGLANVLNANLRGLVVALNAISEQKEGSEQ